MEKEPPPPYEASSSASLPTERTSLLPPRESRPPSYRSVEPSRSSRTASTRNVPEARNVTQGEDENVGLFEGSRRGMWRGEWRDRGRGRQIDRWDGLAGGRWREKGRRRGWGRMVKVVLVIVAFGIGVWYLANVMFDTPAPEVVRVAVIGAGPAGISTAYALSQLSNLPIPLKITIFEEKDTIGGRLFLSSSSSSTQSAKIHAEDIATGALLTTNSILAQRAEKLLNLKRETLHGDEGKVVKVGYWDGHHIVSVQTNPVPRMSWPDWFASVGRYGLPAVVNAKKLPIGTMRVWRDVLASKKDISAVEGAVGLSARERLNKNGVKGRFVDEIVGASLRRQVGQGVDEVSDLVVSMGFEREFYGAPSLGKSGGRLEDVLRRFLDESGAEVRLDSRVSSLQKVVVASELGGNETVEWEIHTNNLTSSTSTAEGERFDKIIIASPWNTTSLLSKSKASSTDQIDYRSQYQNIIISSSKINASYFGKSSAEDLPEQILPIPSSSDSMPNGTKSIQSITFLRPVYGPDHRSSSTMVEIERVEYLYVIASLDRLEREMIEMFWGEGEVKEWRQEEIRDAFPLLYPRSLEEDEDGNGFEVDADGVWHTGVMEGVASSVDWSWVVGGRVAEVVGGVLRGVGE